MSLLDFITFINGQSKELCAYVIILHVLTIDRVHGYWFCKRLLVLIETVPFTRVNVTALNVAKHYVGINKRQTAPFSFISSKFVLCRSKYRFKNVLCRAKDVSTSVRMQPSPSIYSQVMSESRVSVPVFIIFSAVPNNFKHRQNAPCTVLVFIFFCCYKSF